MVPHALGIQVGRETINSAEALLQPLLCIQYSQKFQAKSTSSQWINTVGTVVLEDELNSK